jgi:hypothetical protein
VKRSIRLLFVIVFLGGALQLAATPSRVAGLDTGYGLVPDDTEVAVFPQMIPQYSGRMQVDRAGDQAARGLINLGLGSFGAAAFWFNPQLRQEPLWDAAGALASSGNSMNAWSPWAKPLPKLALGWGIPISRYGGLGIMAQWGQQQSSKDWSAQDGGQGNASLGSGSLLGFVGAFAGASGLTVTAMQERSYGNSLLVCPGLGVNLGRFSIDLAADLSVDKVQNDYQERWLDAPGMKAGQASVTLHDSSDLSRAGRARILVPMPMGTLAATGGLAEQKLGLEEQRHAQAGVSGSLQQLDQKGDEWKVRRQPWQGMLGWMVRPYAKTLLVFGAGAEGGRQWSSSSQRQALSGADPSSSTGLVRLSEETQSWFQVPVVAGGEHEIFPWMRVRVAAMQVVAGQRDTEQQIHAHASPDGPIQRVEIARQTRQINEPMRCVVGLGLLSGSLQWDHSLNLGDGSIQAASYASSLVVQW